MRFFNVNLISFVLIIGILSGLATDASAKRKKLLKKKGDTTLVVPKPKENKDSVEYHKLIKDAVTREGLLTTHFTPQKKLYWEIPDSAFAHTYMLSNRIAATSNTQDFVAGQMATQPILLQLSCDSINVYLHKVQTQNSVDENESIAAAFDKNFLNPVLKAFKIEARNKGNVVIDVTSFFGGNEKCISPIKPSNPLAKLFGGDSGIKRVVCLKCLIGIRSKDLSPQYRDKKFAYLQYLADGRALHRADAPLVYRPARRAHAHASARQPRRLLLQRPLALHDRERQGRRIYLHSPLASRTETRRP